MLRRRSLLAMPFAAAALRAQGSKWKVEIEQLTQGPRNHFFGYIGHVRNTPWNGNGRYMALLRTSFQDHMPAPAEAADVVLVDTKNRNEVIPVDRSHAWNPQQGTMFYWNPKAADTQLIFKAADTQLIFNDRDVKTNRVFAALYDVVKKKRVKEYRFEDTPFGNGGVAQNGKYFLGINYGRMARLRPVTGYPGAFDWNPGTPVPENDGIFITEIESGKKRLLVSFRQLAEHAAKTHPEIRGRQLFINHTLWNRNDTRIYFFVRADFESKDRINLPFTIHPDGSHLTMQEFTGGHPEWDSGTILVGDRDKKQILYDADTQKVTGQLGTPEIFPDPGGDSAISFDRKWYVQGYRRGKENVYSFLRREDGTFFRTRGIPIDNWVGGDLRLDPAPCWNRTSDMVAVPGLAEDAGRTRQTFLLRIVS